MEKNTLSQFVQKKREKLGLSAGGLAKKSNIELDIIEKIEAGEELFLPTTIRQNLAKGLKCSLEEIKHCEKAFENRLASDYVIENIKKKILAQETDLNCPLCGAPLHVKVVRMYDLEDNLMLHPKAACTKCVFQIKS